MCSVYRSEKMVRPICITSRVVVFIKLLRLRSDVIPVIESDCDQFHVVYYVMQCFSNHYIVLLYRYCIEEKVL